MKYASLKYSISTNETEFEEIRTHHKRVKFNIGDNIQSIAAEQFLPIVDKRFNRDALNKVLESEKYLLIMNGWYTVKVHLIIQHLLKLKLLRYMILLLLQSYILKKTHI